MKEKPKTKDQLLEEIVTLKNRNQEMTDDLVSYRSNLSNILGAGYKHKQWSDQQEQILYSWPQIFCEIGKLLEAKNDHDFQNKTNDSIHHLQERMRNVQNTLYPDSGDKENKERLMREFMKHDH